MGTQVSQLGDEEVLFGVLEWALPVVGAEHENFVVTVRGKPTPVVFLGMAESVEKNAVLRVQVSHGAIGPKICWDRCLGSAQSHVGFIRKLSVLQLEPLQSDKSSDHLPGHPGSFKTPYVILNSGSVQHAKHAFDARRRLKHEIPASDSLPSKFLGPRTGELLDSTSSNHRIGDFECFNILIAAVIPDPGNFIPVTDAKQCVGCPIRITRATVGVSSKSSSSEILDAVNEEDRIGTAMVHRGMKANLARSGHLSYLERPNHEFGQYLARQVTGSTACPTPDIEALSAAR